MGSVTSMPHVWHPRSDPVLWSVGGWTLIAIAGYSRSRCKGPEGPTCLVVFADRPGGGFGGLVGARYRDHRSWDCVPPSPRSVGHTQRGRTPTRASGSGSVGVLIGDGEERGKSTLIIKSNLK